MDINLEMPSVRDDLVVHSAVNTDNYDHMNEILSREVSLDSMRNGNGDGVDINDTDDNVAGTVSCYEPQNGLEFETKEAAYSFYREYARSVGFGITIKSSRRSKKSGKFIDVKIACSRFGSKRESSASANARSCSKTDCKASMHMKRRVDGKWYILSVVKEHNHEICPDDFYFAIRGRHKHRASFVCQKKGLQLALDTEDVNLLLDYLTLMQSKSPNFYYAVDLNKDKLLNNVLWIDAKGRSDYRNFFDAVFFDTSYLRKGYKIPFVPVVGVNHHFQYILLGSALIGDETSSSFDWLMRTWLRAVGGQSPTVVITANDASLKEAVADVFPESRHCYCLWHILELTKQNLTDKADNYEGFDRIFKICIHQSRTDEEFQNRWQEMVDKFELRDDEWFMSLYEDRKKWVPTYMRDTFLGGFCTIERSESISFFFDEYLHKETTFPVFLDEYKSYLLYRNEEEERAECETRNEKPILKTISSFEKQMATIYTHSIFKKFQAEILGIVACNLQREAKDETTVTYRINDLEGNQNFIVAWKEEDSDISCSCRSFEYRGFLCRHAMIVLQLSGVSTIPSQYILKRWTRNAMIRDTMSVLSSSLGSRVQRLNNLCKLACRLGEEGSLSQEAYDIALVAIEEALKQCVGVNSSMRTNSENDMLVTLRSLNSEDGNLESNMAKTSKSKKLLKKCRVQQEVEASAVGMQSSNKAMLQQEVEASATGMQSSNKAMEELKGRILAPESSCVPQADVQGMGQMSSLAFRPGYYSNLHGMQGFLGNFNSISTQVGHYSPQQNLQGLLQGQLGYRAPAARGCYDIQDTLQDMRDR